MPPTSLSDSPNSDSHELQPLHKSESTSHHRNNRSSAGKTGTEGSDSDDYDEEFADETFRLRGPNGGSLELDRDGVDDEDAELVHEIRHGGRLRSSAKAKLAKLRSDDPADLVSRVVPETDDPTLPTLTFRVLVIGAFFCCVGAGISQVRVLVFVSMCQAANKIYMFL